jgi:prepilin peptidase CpaA
MNNSQIILMAVVLYTAIAAFFDWTRFRSPNAVTIPFAGLGIAYHVLTSGWLGLRYSLLGMFVGFLLLVTPFLFGGFGGGDVKLLAGAGAWLGANGVITIFAVSAILLGIVSLIKIAGSSKIRLAGWYNLKIAYHNATSNSKFLVGNETVEEVVLQEDRDQRLVPFAVVFADGLAALIGWSWAIGEGLNIPNLFFSLLDIRS